MELSGPGLIRVGSGPTPAVLFEKCPRYGQGSTIHPSSSLGAHTKLCPLHRVDLVQVIMAAVASWGQWPYHVQKTVFHNALSILQLRILWDNATVNYFFSDI